MNDEFFGETTPSHQYQQPPHSHLQQSQAYDYSNQHYQQNDDSFDFGQINDAEQPKQSNNLGGSYNNIGGYTGQETTDDETTRKIKEQEERIQEMLRQKANQQHQEKKRRKEQGRLQLEGFIEQKERQKNQRKDENLQKQKQNQQSRISMNNMAGWRKVASNVPLKQGEHPSYKDTNRMRQAIINKKNDQAQ